MKYSRHGQSSLRGSCHRLILFQGGWLLVQYIEHHFFALLAFGMAFGL